MTDDTIDRLIDEALDAEERELLRQIGEEPGYLTQAMGAFGGRLGWVNLVLMIAQTALFFIGLYAAWRFFEAPDVLTALRWGIPAAVLFLSAVMLKLSIWPTIQTNRVLREMKRVELQLARIQSRAAAGG